MQDSLPADVFKDRLSDVMRGIPQERQDREPVKAGDPIKIIRCQLIPGIEAAAPCQHVISAVFKEPAEVLPHGIHAEPLQVCAPDLIGEPVHRILEVFCCLHPCDCHQYRGEGSVRIIFNTVGVHQVARHFLANLWFHLPNIRRLSSADHMSVGDIENVAQTPAGPAVIDQGDAL